MDDGSFAHPLEKLRGQPAPDVSKQPSVLKAPVLDAAGLLPPSAFAQNPSDGYVFQYDSTQQRPVWASKTTLGYGTTLPASPADGDEYILVDNASTPTFQWRFRYNASSGNTDKWEFVGGPAAYSEVTTSEALSGTGYAALSTAGPSVALPRAGVYEIAIGFTHSAAGGSNQQVCMSYDIGGTGAVDADRIVSAATGTTAPPGGSVARTTQKSGLTAVTLTAKYRLLNGAHTGSAQNRWMRVLPVRVS